MTHTRIFTSLTLIFLRINEDVTLDIRESLFLDLMDVTLSLEILLVTKGWILEFLFFCFLAITTSNLHQIQKVRSDLKSAGSENFKTNLTLLK